MRFLLLFLLLLCSCAMSPSKDFAEQQYAYEQTNLMAEPYPEADMAVSAKSSVGKRRYKKETAIQNQAAPARMMYYNGYLKLIVPRVEETLQKIIQLTKDVEGKIERQSTTSLTIRVPRASFQSTFNTIKEYGTVLSKSISAEDVTEAFTSTELRLKTSKATRERLLALLEKAKDEKEKIQILQQIQRLSEEIDTIEARLRTLDSLAKMSRITIELAPRQSTSNQNETLEADGFQWIRKLSPFYASVTQRAKRLSLVTPEGMVMLNKRGPYVAESADGAVLRTGTLKNQPRGANDFWQDAILSRLKGEFETAEKVKAGTYGAFDAIRFTATGERPYVYVIAVQATKKKLHFVEIYYPTLAVEKRHSKNITNGIGGAQ